MHYNKVHADRAEEITKLTAGQVIFDCIGNDVKGLTINTQIGPIRVVIENYGVTVIEPRRIKVYRIKYWRTIDGTRFQFEKQFDTDCERDAFIQNNFLDEIPSEDLEKTEAEIIA